MGKVVCLMPLRTISEGWVSDSKIGVSLYFDLPAIMSQFPTPETGVDDRDPRCYAVRSNQGSRPSSCAEHSRQDSNL